MGAIQVPLADSRTSSRSVRVAATGPLWIAVPFGVLVAYDVARVQEVVPVLDVPRLPLILGLICLVATVPSLVNGGFQALWHRSVTFRAQVGLLGLALLTMPIGIWPIGSWFYFKEKYIIQWIVFVVGAYLFRDRRALRLVVAIFAIAVSIAAYEAVFGGAGVQKDVERVYVAASLDPNDFGAILVVTIPLVLWLVGGASGLGKLLWTAAAFLMVGAIAPTASRGALLGIMSVALVLILVGTTGFRRIFMGGAVAIGALTFSLVVSDEQMARFGNVGGEDDYNTNDGEGRIAIWKRGIVWTIKRPTGYGLNNFPVYFGWLNGPDRAAHNSLVQIAVELGVAGLGLFLMAFFHGIRDTQRYFSRLGGRGPPVADARREISLARLVLASLVGAFVTGFFLSNAYAGITMLVLAIAAGLQFGRLEPGSGQRVGPVPAMASRRRHRRAAPPGVGLPFGRVRRRA